jgi:opacity protein-like surface antigen
MKSTVYGIFAWVLLLACTGRIADAATPYLKGSGGIAMLGSSGRSYDSGYAVACAAGLDNGQYRLEAELGSQKSDISHSAASVSIMTYMANGYIDIDLPLSPAKPFLFAGVGVASVADKIVNYTVASDTVLAWQAGAGASFSMAPLVNIDVQYRYFSASDPELTGHNHYKIDSHNVLLGLKVGF